MSKNTLISKENRVGAGGGGGGRENEAEEKCIMKGFTLSALQKTGLIIWVIQLKAGNQVSSVRIVTKLPAERTWRDRKCLLNFS